MIYFTKAQLQEEMNRCLYCPDKPCQQACPVHCSPADFIMAARQGEKSDFQRAAQHILSQNPFGQTCGLVCPDTFCMDACSRKLFDKPIQIPKVQATIMAIARKDSPKITAKMKAVNSANQKETSHLNESNATRSEVNADFPKVAVVGAGPSGMTAASFLALKGYSVEIFETEKELGGSCLQIPEERLPRKALKADIDEMLSWGKIKVKKNSKPSLAELKKKYPAIIWAVGENQPQSLSLKNEKLAVPSKKFLLTKKQKLSGKRVAIIGGGAVAVDCATTAKTRGATSVELIVRRSWADMRLTQEERSWILEKKINVSNHTRPLDITKKTNKYYLKTIKTEFSNKGQLIDVYGTQMTRAFDLVILAIGSQAYEGDLIQDPQVFLTGDLEHGSSTVVEAAASGKNTAQKVHDFLLKQKAQKTKERKSIFTLDGIYKNPVDLSTDFFGRKLSSPFLLSAAPATDGIGPVEKAYQAGWPGVVLKTAFDGLPIHIPSEYMVAFSEKTFGNADNVSDHTLERVCKELKILIAKYPDRLTMASTGGPVTGNDEADKKVWQSNTKKLENAGAMGVEYSLSCPQGGDGTEGSIVSQNARVTAKVIDWVMEISDPHIPKLFKLTSAVTSVKPILAAIKEVFNKYPGKKAGITLANSFPVLAFRPHLGVKQSRYDEEGLVVGMSGEGVAPMSYLALAEASSFGLHISGNGGVMDYRSAVRFLALGVKTVQVCTVATRYGLGVIDELESGLSFYLQENNYRSVAELIGSALPRPITDFMDLPAEKHISTVDKKLCEHCGVCQNCPYGAIELKNYPIINPKECVGCSLCVKQCFAGALSMQPRSLS